MPTEYHYPPDLFQLLVDVIPLLCKSKQDVITFFAGAGVDNDILDSLYQQIKNNKDVLKKHEIVRIVLTYLNEQGDAHFVERQSILRRVVQWQNFSTCYPDNVVKAEELVKSITRFVNVGSIHSIREETERCQERIDFFIQQKERHKKHSEFQQIKTAFSSLYHQSNPQKRGKLLEVVLNNYFKASGILVRDAFFLTEPDGDGIVEQIDGAVDINRSLYLVEMKWWSEPIGVAEISHHIGRLYSRSHVSGIFISASGFTKPAIRLCKETLANKLIILCELKEIIFLLDKGYALDQFFEKKIQAAILEKKPLFYPNLVDILI